MNSRRELDALVAEKIMGFKLSEHGGNPIVILPSGEWDRLADYSSDIAAAWAVVEKLKDADKTYGFELRQDQGEIYEWIAEFNDRFRAESETVPHAICLAALKAVGAIK